jgi:hypothetical protein
MNKNAAKPTINPEFFSAERQGKFGKLQGKEKQLAKKCKKTEIGLEK